jgi:hypothetical protein
MVKIIETRQAAGPARPFELDVYRTLRGRDAAHAASHGLVIRFGTPPQEALDIAMDFCTQQGIQYLWVIDPGGIFPPEARDLHRAA